MLTGCVFRNGIARELWASVATISDSPAHNWKPSQHAYSFRGYLSDNHRISVLSTLPFFVSWGDFAFSEYFFTITVFSLYGEYVVRFPLPDCVF